jgi:hypothetical protein
VRATLDVASGAILATNLRRILLVKMAASRPAFAESIDTRNVTIFRPLPADFCLRGAGRARAASDRQTSPVRASWGCPADGGKWLIARVFAALGLARLRFRPCFRLKSRGETGALAPLFAASVPCADDARLCVEREEGDDAAARQGWRRQHTTQPGDNASGNPLRFRRQCGGCLRFPAGSRQGNSYPARRVRCAHRDAPISLRQHDFSANRQAEFGLASYFSLPEPHFTTRGRNSAIVVSTLSLPARSLRGRPASLRTVPDGAGCLLRKRLIWHGLLVIGPAISGVEPIFLPALREPGVFSCGRVNAGSHLSASRTVIAFEQGEVVIPRPAVIQRIAASARWLGRLPKPTDSDSRPPGE